MKNARHVEILRLIRESRIEKQEELVKKLNEIGFSVTQATVSRDIRQLKLTKVAGPEGNSYYVEAEPQKGNEDRRFRVFRDSFSSMDTAGNILVIKTAPGMAMAAAAVIDELGWQEIVGSIAGDNTIMCAARSSEDAESVMRKFEGILQS